MKKKINKIGAALTVLTFGLICGISGYELHSSTDSVSSPLPVSKGGTGGNSFPANSVLVGNGPLSFGSRGIDTTPQNGSNNLITSDALYKETAVEDAPIAPYGNWTFTTNQSNKIGHICSINVKLRNGASGITAATSSLVGYIDSKCIPAASVYFVLTVQANGQDFSNILLGIDNIGRVYIYNFSGVNIVSGREFSGSTTYVVY
ncbi:MAG: hypothetical protein LBB10_00450 [Bifidobacteriaceae bacterium]|jgi:hypothetical protein|nr:hypothetical protein [Bifidobacteriaceae bacterium]